ncbi:MAG: flavodoxin [Oscillospiraceae bacterium]|nr:flavodoxin [Oscillospiraceae bacterium]
MKAAIRYYTRSGNTKKLADAIAQALGIEAKDVTAPLDARTEVLFLCNSVYWAGVDGSVKQFIRDNHDRIGTLVNVSTAALIESSYPQIRKLCEQAGVTVSDAEFHCKGSFQMLHRGRPDSEDLAAVGAFAGKVLGEAG